MNLELPESSSMLSDTFERFFETESSIDRVRAAEPTGFDPELWRAVVEMGAPTMRIQSDLGGEMSLFDTMLILKQAGRRLVSVPLAEAIVTLRVLDEIGSELAKTWIERSGDGETVLTIALRPIEPGKKVLTCGGAVAAGVMAYDGEALLLLIPTGKPEPVTALAGCALAHLDPGACEKHTLATGDEARRLWDSAVEEWRLLNAAMLIGLSQQAIQMAADYASERQAFGVQIGTYQSISHPLADDVIDADGGELLLWWIAKAIGENDPEAPAMSAFAWWWAVGNATRSVAHAVHTLGGYGLTNEYDVQLYNRRAKAFSLVGGDPSEALEAAGRRLFLDETVALPPAGDMPLDFKPAVEELGLVEETRAFFEEHMPQELRGVPDHSFEGHHWEFSRALGKAGLLMPSWPKQWGGRGVTSAAARESAAVWNEFGYTGTPRQVAFMVGEIVMRFGTPELQQEVLPRIGGGEILTCLGYTEPSGGSDVFAAKTRAVRDGDEWVINGQKMFTSGANMASYVLLLTRTDPDLPKHKGITLFLVPMDSPGIEVQPIFTYMDERTNATFYSDVRIPDRYRLGEVNGGVKVMSAALQLEQGASGYHQAERTMVKAAAEWARRNTRGGKPAIEHPDVLSRLARTQGHARIIELMAVRSIWSQAKGRADKAQGPASKVFTTSKFISDSADLLDLTAPDSLVRGKSGIGLIEQGYRHSAATSVYGGTSEVLRSMVAERRLGMPRSRA
ncbi:acyl-CoA dehydrogenase [Novosphingobium pentaromativorans]|uniref:Acyl-CoA dehydrogenase n=1 Tax=Novosphingobium pentaromativorans US6-1 TaxID=1088721 RepID=G6E7Z5_9SPHN|nr:acyl-CoA dehydrogenase family protein [Novosphingobium pentaromativorans]AIT81487.1 hypothetical protein JI59_17765 [Novosphingobium pentaromativorans US6-1]EHJ62638.1 hypothetical protein NSU_0466 [Novosphingobium pentaromativorans US6-1]